MVAFIITQLVSVSIWIPTDIPRSLNKQSVSQIRFSLPEKSIPTELKDFYTDPL